MTIALCNSHRGNIVIFAFLGENHKCPTRDQFLNTIWSLKLENSSDSDKSLWAALF